MTIRRVVLAVDDDPRVLDAYQAILESRYEVLTAPDGRAALEILQARTVDLVLRRMANAVILEVGDDGVGFDPLGAFPGHLGLRSMQERVSQLGGRLQIESAPGQGTHLLIRIPSGKPLGDGLDDLPSR